MGLLKKASKVREKKEKVAKVQSPWRDPELGKLAVLASKGDIRALKKLLILGKKKRDAGALSEEDIERLQSFAKNLKKYPGVLEKLKKTKVS